MFNLRRKKRALKDSVNRKRPLFWNESRPDQAFEGGEGRRSGSLPSSACGST